MRFSWSPPAMRDRVGIYDYIEGDSPRAAADVDDRLTERIRALLEFPQSGRPGRMPETRELVVAGTSYVVAYSVRDDVVRILRILHGAQRWPQDAEEDAGL